MSDAAAVEATDDNAGTGAEATGEAAKAAEVEATAKAAAEAAAATAGASAGKEGANVIWPDKWREEWAGVVESAKDADPKVTAERLKRLGRWDHPGRVFESLLEIETKYKQADIRTPFPDDGNDNDKVKWRKKNGIPSEPAGYFDKLPEGIKVAEEDKAGMDTLAEAMHAGNHTTDATHTAMGAYYKHVNNVLADRAVLDKKSQEDSEDSLREIYGTDTRRNINDIQMWPEKHHGPSKELLAKILNSRMLDGMPLGNDVDFLKWHIGQMRRDVPLVTVPGLGGGDPVAALDDEIAAIEKTIQTDNRAYRADKAMSDRYLELLKAREKRK